MIRHEAPAQLRQEELSRYLKRAWPLLSGHVLRELLKKRDVRINGTKSGRGDLVHGGDVLEIYAQEKYFTAPAEVLFDDGRLLAVVKPQGLPSLPDADGVGADTMELRAQHIHPEARLCHRLDAATGGVMLCAMDEDVYEQLLAAFRKHRLRKSYRALLTARPTQGEGTLHAYLLKDARRASVCVVNKPASGAKEIITRFKLLGERDGLWEAELEPVTGRTHQLRAHMAHIGCPILGDDKYGDREKNKALGFVGRLCLWCEAMEIPADSGVAGYAGMRFHSSRPDWLEK